VDVRQFWIDRASNGANESATSAIKTKAKKASDLARAPEALAKAQATRARNIAARNEVAGE
jgi:hypothetical protein